MCRKKKHIDFCYCTYLHFDTVMVPIVVMDRHMRIYYLNHAARMYTRLSTWSLETYITPNCFSRLKTSLTQYEVSVTKKVVCVDQKVWEIHSCAHQRGTFVTTWQDTTDLWYFKKDSDMLRRLIDSAPVAFSVADMKGRVFYSNPKSKQLFQPLRTFDPNYEKVELQDYGQYVGFDINNRRMEADRWPLARSLIKSEIVENELIRLVFPDNTERFIVISSGPIYDDDNEQIGGYFISEDLERMLLLDEKSKVLVESARLTYESAKMKSRFIANISHDIRTPITSILGIASLLKLNETKEENMNLIDDIIDAAYVLSNFANDIVDLTKIEADTLTLKITDFSVLKVIQMLIGLTRSFKSSLHKINQEVLFSHDQLPPYVKGDENRYVQALSSIIHNAVKFTPEKGHVKVHLWISDNSKEDQIEISCAVKDDGIGINDETKKHLFSLLSNASLGSQHHRSGFGMGLYITKNLVDLMDGNVIIESQEGRGTEVIVSVWFGRVGTRADSLLRKTNMPTYVAANLNVEERGRRKVMLVEDNRLNATITKKFLQMNGYMDVTTVEDGRAAVKLAQSNRFDIILMDCQMPVMDGFKATKNIRVFNKTVPIIAVTASGTQDDENEIYASGMNDILLKPFVAHDLIQIVDKYIAMTINS